MEEPLDTTTCPLCSNPNACAIANKRDAEACWCMNATMDPDALGRIPKEAQGKVCICATCAKGEQPTATAS